MRLRDILRKAGFEGENLDVAAMVVGAESGGDPSAKNKKACGTRADGSPAYAVGLMQICTVHLDKGGILEGWTEDDLRNPVANARAGKIVLDAQGWGAWATYTNGAFRRYIRFNPDLQTSTKGGGSISDIAKSALGTAWDIIDIDLPDVGGAVSDTANAVADIPGAIGDAVHTLTTPSTWFQIGKVILGGALVLMGVAGVVFVVGKTASSATPVGAIRKAIK